MAAIASAAIAGSIALAQWYANKRRRDSAANAAETAFTNRENEAYKRRAVLASIIQQNPAFRRLGLTEEQLKGIVGSPRRYVPGGGDPGAGQYADLGASLLGASQAYQRAPQAMGSTYGEGTMPPDFGAGSDFGTSPGISSGSRLVPCPEGWVDNNEGGCEQAPFGARGG